MVYEWKPNAPHPKADAQVVGEHLENLRIARGGLTPHLVLEDARPDTALLHDAIDWDDAVAGPKWRLEQAGQILRVIVAKADDASAEAPFTRAFVVVSPDDSEHQVYTSNFVAMADETLRRQVLARALNELDAFQRKYQDLEELADVFVAAERVAKTIQTHDLTTV